MNPVLKKMLYKGQSSCLVLKAPPEFLQVMNGFEAPVDTAPNGKYVWALAFVRSLKEAEEIAKAVPSFLQDNGIFWLAYPKSTSKKYKADINRDKGNDLMASYRLVGVFMVAIDDDWSAIRFKRTI